MSTEPSARRPGQTTDLVRAVVEYDGTQYRGFQRLSSHPTIQTTIETTLSRITGRDIRIAGAGRTDAGVHALGQVIAFRPHWRWDLTRLQNGLNALLPRDIAIREMTRAEPGFHPRRSALCRWYRYTVLNTPVRSPLRLRHAHHVPNSLDVEACEAVCARMVGTRDFGAFASAHTGTTVRILHHASCTREAMTVHVDLVLSSAFSHLVRRLVGTLLRVGTGAMSAGMFFEIMDSRDRRRAAPASPACGLCLMEVFY